MTAISLQSLARSAAQPNYVTTARDLDLIKSLQTDPELGEMGEIALALFTQLQDPGAVDEAGRPEATAEQQQKVLRRIKEIFGVADPPPLPPQPARDSSAAGAPAPEGGTPSWEEVTVSPMRNAEGRAGIMISCPTHPQCNPAGSLRSIRYALSRWTLSLSHEGT